MIVFTIAACNFVPYARALHASLVRHHPDCEFVLALCDLDPGFDHRSFPFEVLNLEGLRDVRVWTMAERYNITEFCTAIKPAVFKLLMDRNEGMTVLYLDPDMWVTGRMAELENMIEAGALAVLTPHLIGPSSRPELFRDQECLKYGSYNLGFLALREGPDTRRLLEWWSERLERDCRIDLQDGLFVDQKWADLFPAFFQGVEILRHPGYNVAYWNVLDRRVARTTSGWQVNDTPLRIVHFSGHDLLRPDIFSRNAIYLDRWNVGDLFLLQSEWREVVLASGYRECSALHYGFRYSGEDTINVHTPVELADQIADGALTINHAKGSSNDLFRLSIANWIEWVSIRASIEAVFADQRSVEAALLPEEEVGFSISGKCTMCRTDSTFVTSFEYSVHVGLSGNRLPNWREHLDCRCRFNNRIRGAMYFLETLTHSVPEPRLYITEHVTRLFGWVASRFSNSVGSEYLGPEAISGQTVNGTRHEDLCRLSFESGTFDVVVSLDVLEHVADIRAALRECFRVLAPGGSLLFAAPTQFDEHGIIDLVLTGRDGTRTFLRPPEYHGNPVDPDRPSLCYRYLGLEVLDVLRGIGFIGVSCEVYWSMDAGFLGPMQNLFIGRKPSGSKTRGRENANSPSTPKRKRP